MHPLSGDIVATVVYGTAATIIGLVTIYQAHKAWTLWHSHRQSQDHPQSDVELGPGPSRATCHPLEIPEAVALPAQVSGDALVMALQHSQSGLGNTPSHNPAQGCDQASRKDNLVSSTADATSPRVLDLGERLSTKPSTSPYNNKQEH